MGDLISIKGGRDGLRMRFDDTADWGDLLAQLARQLAQSQAFFSGARLTIELGERAVSEAQLAEILGLMQQHGVAAEALSANARESRNAARSAGLTARPLPRYSEPSPAAPEGAALPVPRPARWRAGARDDTCGAPASRRPPSPGSTPC